MALPYEGLAELKTKSTQFFFDQLKARKEDTLFAREPACGLANISIGPSEACLQIMDERENIELISGLLKHPDFLIRAPVALVIDSYIRRGTEYFMNSDCVNIFMSELVAQEDIGVLRLLLRSATFLASVIPSKDYPYFLSLAQGENPEISEYACDIISRMCACVNLNNIQFFKKKCIDVLLGFAATARSGGASSNKLLHVCNALSHLTVSAPPEIPEIILRRKGIDAFLKLAECDSKFLPNILPGIMGLMDANILQFGSMCKKLVEPLVKWVKDPNPRVCQLSLDCLVRFCMRSKEAFMKVMGSGALELFLEMIDHPLLDVRITAALGIECAVASKDEGHILSTLLHPNACVVISLALRERPTYTDTCEFMDKLMYGQPARFLHQLVSLGGANRIADLITLLLLDPSKVNARMHQQLFKCLGDFNKVDVPPPPVRLSHLLLAMGFVHGFNSHLCPGTRFIEETEICPFSLKLMNSFSLVRSSFPDVCLVVEGKLIPCHRVVLSSISTYFSVLFSSQFAEKDQTEIELKEVEFALVEKIIASLYHPNTLTIDSFEEVFALLRVSDMYQLLPLHNLFLSTLPRVMSEVTWERCLEWFPAFTAAHGREKVKVLAWLCDNWEFFEDKEKAALLKPHLSHFECLVDKKDKAVRTILPTK